LTGLGLCVNLAKNNTMERLSEFCYEENGLKIVFTELPKEAPHLESFYEFEVQGDTELTDKVRKAVMNKRVTYSYFFECASALFEIIKSGDFEEVPAYDYAKQVFAKFEKLTGEEPKLVVKKTSTHPPRRIAMILNCIGLKKVITADARNSLTAKVKAVEEYIKQIGG
jgi:hypothetical protein